MAIWRGHFVRYCDHSAVPIKVYDPWLPERDILNNDCSPSSLDELLSTSDAIFVFASVTAENQGFLVRVSFRSFAVAASSC